jgi:hypothetical protein
MKLKMPKLRADVQEFLENLGTKEKVHSGATIFSHLQGTFRILKGWHCHEDVCVAGALHNVYSSKFFPRATMPSREQISSRFGCHVERLVYSFQFYRRFPVESTESLVQVMRDGLCISEKEKSQTEFFSPKDLEDLLALDFANFLEQLLRVDIPSNVIQSEKLRFLRFYRYLPDFAKGDFIMIFCTHRSWVFSSSNQPFRHFGRALEYSTKFEI